jgi:hypothetical protein
VPSPSPQPELPPLNRIRVETALSRFPVHRLVRKGTIAIDLKRSTEDAQTDFRWKVSYNSEFGQPGPLAYKIDTLIVNRRVDEAPRPLPEVIKLGSLREICRDAKITDHNTDLVKLALHQNASAYITAKVTYKTRSGREKRAEIGYTRYSVVFTGETLPDGTKADAVYIVINPSYRDMLNQVEVRPLDYDYLQQLSPGSQRLYELLSFQIYGALASGRPRAKMLYSDYCRYAPQTRYPDFEHVKKQMYKVHLPHRESGYLAKVEYQECTDREGHPDWEMLYTPGPKAVAEFQAFTNRRGHLVGERRHLELPLTKPKEGPVQASLDLSGVDETLLAELTRRGVTEKKARELLSQLAPGQQVREQLEYLDSVIAHAPQGKFHNPPGLYIRVVQQNGPVPESFVSSRKRQLLEEVKQKQHAHLAQQAQLEAEYDNYRQRESERFLAEAITPEEYQSMFDDHRSENRRVFPRLSTQELEQLSRAAVILELRENGRIPLLSLEEFRRKQGLAAGKSKKR